MIIGILGRPNKFDMEMITFSRAVVDIIIKYGGIPLGILPNQEDINRELSKEEEQSLYKLIDFCDGIILQGGKDYYAYDMAAIKYINQRNIPVLGICLGMQSMAAATGGELGMIENHQHPGVNEAHDVNISQSSTFFKIVKKECFKVNSRHCETVINPGQYKVVGKTPDDVIEAIELDDKAFNIGVQWHPENINDSSIETQQLFQAFFQACYYFHNQK